MSKVVKIGDIASLKTGPFGTQFSAKEYTSEGIPVINVKNIGYGQILENELDYIHESTRDRLSEHILKTGDIVFGRKGSVDRHAYISQNYSGWVQGSDCIRLRFQEDVNTRYISHYLKLDHVKKQINHASIGSTMASLNTDILKNIKNILPELSVQNSIETVLSSLESKVDVNSQICSELETMAKALYDYWFVQFDFPDENGRPYRTSGGAMEWNDQLKREIPKGWGVKSIIDEFDVCCGYPFDTTKFTEDEDGIPIIRIRDILENTISAKTLEIVDEKYKVNRGDLIVGMDGNFHMNFWSGHSALLNQRCFKISSLGYSVLIAYFSAKPYIKAREKNVTRTTVGHLSADDVQALSVLVPTEPEKQKFSAIFDDILNKICQTRSENEELTKLRDWLLPMLMNGQARVE